VSIVIGILMSHAPGITSKPQLVDEQRWRSLKGFEAGRELLESAAPDVIVAFVNDHFQNFFLDGMPAFCFGIGEEHVVPAPDLAHIVGLPVRRFRGEPKLSKQLLQYAMESGFDPAFSEELRFVDELGVPFSFLLTETVDIPVIPIMINCVAPPLPSWKRCMELGTAVGSGLAKLARDRRVMILGSGGLAHWIGTPETGRINSEFDRRVLALIEAGEGNQLASWNDDKIFFEAGNGAFELRNWAAALGAVGPCKAKTLGYAPAPEWLTGMGAMSLHIENVRSAF
jgi:hypothetical protein